MEEAILAVELLNALAIAGANMVIATQEVSAMLKAKHAVGQKFTKADALAYMDKGDLLQGEVLARAKAALGAIP